MVVSIKIGSCPCFTVPSPETEIIQSFFPLEVDLLENGDANQTCYIHCDDYFLEVLELRSLGLQLLNNLLRKVFGYVPASSEVVSTLKVCFKKLL